MKCVLILCLTAACLLAGCSGVILNSTYSTLLDESAAIAAVAAERADANALSVGDMKAAIRYEAGVLRRFQDARDGRAPK